jgi:hypothetical protein
LNSISDIIWVGIRSISVKNQRMPGQEITSKPVPNSAVVGKHMHPTITISSRGTATVVDATL